jgi:hypothetical protein
VCVSGTRKVGMWVEGRGEIGQRFPLPPLADSSTVAWQLDASGSRTRTPSAQNEAIRERYVCGAKQRPTEKLAWKERGCLAACHARSRRGRAPLSARSTSCRGQRAKHAGITPSDLWMRELAARPATRAGASERRAAAGAGRGWPGCGTAAAAGLARGAEAAGGQCREWRQDGASPLASAQHPSCRKKTPGPGHARRGRCAPPLTEPQPLLEAAAAAAPPACRRCVGSRLLLRRRLLPPPDSCCRRRWLLLRRRVPPPAPAGRALPRPPLPLPPPPAAAAAGEARPAPLAPRSRRTLAAPTAIRRRRDRSRRSAP